MKRNLLSKFSFSFAFAALLLGSLNINAQSQRMVFVEEFTQASCPPCETSTPQLNATLIANEDKVVQIRYQTSWPGVDPMNADNQADVQTRVDYYGVTGVPSVLVDGFVPSGPVFPELITQANIDGSYNSGAPISVSVDHVLADNLATGTVTVTLTNDGATAYDLANDKLRVAFVEEIISWDSPPGSTSIVDFEYVMKNFLTTAAGQDVGMIMPGASMMIDFTDVDVPSTSYDLRNLAVVAWVQNDDDRSVVNGGVSHAKAVDSATDLSIAALGSAAGGLCDYDYNAMAVVSTSGLDAENVSVDFVLNGSVQATESVSGVIADGQTATVDFGTVQLAPGNNTVEYVLSSSTADVTPRNNQTTPVQIGKASVPMDQILEDIESTEIGARPTNMLGNLPNLGLMGIAVNSAAFGDVGSFGAFGESENALMINFWNWNPANIDAVGTIDVLTQHNVTESSTLTFDHAFTTWGGSNDRLEMQVSTDCGETFTTVWDKSGSNLATAAELNENNAYFIASSGDWVSNEVDLSAYAGSDIIVRMKMTSAWGDMLYVDNIEVKAVTNTNKLEATVSSISPNPARDFALIDLSLEEASAINIQVVDQVGRLVSTQSYGVQNGTTQISLDTNDMPAGLYNVIINVDADAITRKLVVID